MNHKAIATVGLVLNTAGTLLIWRYGLPPSGVSPDGTSPYVEGVTDEQARLKAGRCRLLSNTGMFLIASGFLLQLLVLHV